jgi:pyruvate dehydrogenase E2 component (dihydrolipoamide acetyltransferase)
MPTNVIMPALGVAQQTGTLLKWLKAEGQSVSKGEPLMEIETDKATVEIEAPSSGVLTNVTARPGDEIPVGNRIALILAPGESVSEAAVHSPHPRIESRAGSSPLPQGEGTTRANRLIRGTGAAPIPPLPEGEGRGEGQTSTRLAKPSSLSVTGRILASPAAKRIAREKSVNLAALTGSGPEGSILAADVLRATDGTAVALTNRTVEQMVPLTAMRRIVGERMAQSKQSAPHFYLSMDIGMSAVEKLRAEWKASSEASVPSLNDFILFACARALREFPAVNSSCTEQGTKLHRDINIGMAVALDEGLVVPVIRNAARLSLTELTAQSRALINKAQSKKLLPLDYEGGTFTVSNLGMLGIDSFTAIINPPQCAILAVGRVAPRVVADEGMLAIKSMMTATLSADHRVIDGAIGARFLQEVKKLLESPQI